MPKHVLGYTGCMSTVHPRRVTSKPKQKGPFPVLLAALALVVCVAVGYGVATMVGGTSATSGSGNAANVSTSSASSDALSASDATPSTSSSSKKANPAVPSEPISVATTGDMIFGREVGTYIDEYGGSAALEHVASTLAAADVTIGNVEAPLSDDESEGIWTKDVLLISRPAGIESLKDGDFTFVSLANNHSMDYGAPALRDTLNALDAAGIKHAGAGMTEAQAEEIAETTVKGKSIAFLSFTDVIPDYFLAHGDEAGVVSARINMDWACQQVSDAKATHDYVIVAMHWGNEYEDYITEWQQQTPAHALVDAGADVIWGNHPHVIQGIEFYDGSLIIYSQGDFVFDHYSRKTGETFICQFDLTDNGIENVCALPVYLDDTYGYPEFVYGEEADDILDRLETISEDMNTRFEFRDDKAYIFPID